jgi:LPXTG-motif cell wall-anchored protein
MKQKITKCCINEIFMIRYPKIKNKGGILYMKKTIGIILTVLVLTIIMTSTIFAAGVKTYTIQLDTALINIKQNDEIEVTIRIKDFENMENGLSSIYSELEYDQSFFETLTPESIIAKGTWKPTLDVQNNRISANSDIGIKTESDVFSIKFKVKPNALIGASTTIKIKNFQGSEGNAQIKAKEEATLTLNIVTQEANNQNNNQGFGTLTPNFNGIIDITDTTSNTSNLQGNNNTNNNTTNLIANINNTTGNNIPQTGEEEWIIFAFIAAIVLSIIFYIKYKRTY